MRLVIVSDAPELSDAVADALDGMGVSCTTKEADDFKTLAKEVTESIKKGIAPVYVITGDPMGVSVKLNKTDGISAATCKTSDDMDAAHKGLIGVIVLSSKDASEIAALLSNKPASQKPKPSKPAKAEAKSAAAEEEPATEVEEKKVRAKKEDEEEFVGKRKGFFGRFLDDLGVKDGS